MWLLPRTVTTVLFDWDGTLCDSGAAHLATFQKTLAEFGIAITREQFQAVYTPAWYHMYEAFGLPRAEWPQADRRWMFHYGNLTSELVMGAGSVVARLRAAGLHLGVVTGGNRERVARELARHGLTAAFPAVVCHEDVTRTKPHPEGIRKALEILEDSARHCCYVGDTPDDVLMGRAAGVFTVAVATEYVHRSRLEACGADVLIDRIEHLPTAIALPGSGT